MHDINSRISLNSIFVQNCVVYGARGRVKLIPKAESGVIFRLPLIT